MPHDPPTTPNVRFACPNVGQDMFLSPDGKWLIRVRYATETKECHRLDPINKDHIHHYFVTTDKIHSVSVEAVCQTKQ